MKIIFILTYILKNIFINDIMLDRIYLVGTGVYI